jgi:hypothetical protein
MTGGRNFAFTGLLVLGALPAALAQTWDFEVRLDGRPIGSHRFVVSGPPAARQVESTARFDVTLLGIPLYRYRHEARERWRGDCLQELQSRTDDGGKPAQADLRRDPAEPGQPGCVMSFAYWNPALVRQSQLLNPQTGQIDQVRFERLPEAALPVEGRQAEAVRWQLTATSANGQQQVLVLWAERASGRWIGLDARVEGGRVLTYRLPGPGN